MGKQLIRFVMVVTAIAGLARAAEADSPVPVIAHWSFDTPTITTDANGILTALDETGNHNATRTNAATGPLPINSISGQFGQAAQFTNVNGTDATGASRLEIPNLTEFMGPSGGNFSVAFWANVAVGNDNNDNTVLSDWVTTHTYWFQLDDVDGDTAARPRGQIRDTDGTDIIANTPTAAETTAAVGISNFADGLWHHYAYTYEKTPGTMLFYIDGVLADTVNTGNADHDVRTSGNAVAHLGWKQDSNDHFSDIMDEVWVFNGLLTPDQVVELRESNFGVPVNLSLQVNTVTGAVTIENTTANPILLSSYRITSAGGSLNTSGWDPVSTGTPTAGFPQGDGSGNGWEIAPNASSNELVEWYLTGDSTVANGGSVSLGNAYFPTVAQLVGDYNNNGTVDTADYAVWRDNENTNNPLPNDPAGGTIGQTQYDNWRANFGKRSGVQDLVFRYTLPDGTIKGGTVTYVTPASGSAIGAVPEPATAGLLLMAILMAFAARRRL